MLKRITAIALALALMFALAPTDLSADARKTIGAYGTGGKWSREEQGIRFSVYNTEECRTEATFDTFSYMEYGNYKPYGWYSGISDSRLLDEYDSGGYDSEGKYQKKNGLIITPYLGLSLRHEYDNCSIYYCTGCKLDYLYQYQQGNSIESIASALISSIESGDPYIAIDSNPIYIVVKPEEMGSVAQTDLFRLLKTTPPYSTLTVDSLADYYLVDQTPVSTSIKQMDAQLLETILMYLGFYVNESVNERCSGTLTYFDTNTYVLVIEPVFWCGYSYTYPYDESKEMYFYGTATEWALFGESMKNVVVQNNQKGKYHNETGYGVYAFEYGLVCVELPLACLNHKKSTLAYANGDLVLEPKTSAQIHEEYLDILPDYGKEKITPENTSDISEYIFRYLGYDIITANEIVDLTIDIAETNSEFRPDEEVVLSFYVKQAADTAKKYCPDINDLGSDDCYGIRLRISTLNTGDIKRSDFSVAGLSPDCTIYCDGLPDEDNDGDGIIHNLAYGRFKLPDKTGEWDFKVTVDVITVTQVEGMEFYHTNDSYKSISSNTGKAYQSSGYINFSVKVVDPTASLTAPPDTSAEDIMPTGFAIPDAEEYINSHRKPTDHLSWTYSKAVKQRTAEDTFIVGFEEITEELSTYPAQYVMEPKDNVPSSYRTADGVVNTRSGYGVGARVRRTGASGYSAMNCTPEQKAIMLFPEFGYESYAGRFDRWYKLSEDIMVFNLEKNPNSMYYDDPVNDYNSRAHFIPVWYPDGDYDVILYLYDAWTPVGPLGSVQRYTVRINGTLYDDWYITRQ